MLYHHVPLALASAVVLALFVRLPQFDARAHAHPDLFSDTFPQQRVGDQGGPMRHSGDVGPANLLLRRRNPVSSHLRRDVGTWTALASIVHVIFGLQVHGAGRISKFLNYFVAPDGSPWLNSFGLGNWTGLAALVVVVGLLALSSDFALRTLKASRWKRLQCLNYALFALVIVHAFFYGALLRMTSPFTLLLGLSVSVVIVGQAVGVWLWRRRYSRTAVESLRGSR